MNHELLRDIRVEKGVTQEEMAKCLGYKSKSTYCNIELGVTKVSTDVANKIAARLGMNTKQKISVFYRSKFMFYKYDTTGKGGLNAKPSNKSGGQQVLPGTTESSKVQRKALDESRSR